MESALLFETPEQICARVLREAQPRSRKAREIRDIAVEFRQYANANSSIHLVGERLELRISDALRDAPAPIFEALSHILIAKLFRRPVPHAYNYRYRRYLNRKDVRQKLERLRQTRGRKFLSGSQGEHYNLEELFEDLNFRFFHGLMARPALGWSRQNSRTMLGHYDPSHHAIIVSRVLDQPHTRLALEYVLYHEMLHLRFPVEHRGVRRCVHTQEFREAEKAFPELKKAKEQIKSL